MQDVAAIARVVSRRKRCGHQVGKSVWEKQVEEQGMHRGHEKDRKGGCKQEKIKLANYNLGSSIVHIA